MKGTIDGSLGKVLMKCTLIINRSTSTLLLKSVLVSFVHTYITIIILQHYHRVVFGVL